MIKPEFFKIAIPAIPKTPATRLIIILVGPCGNTNSGKYISNNNTEKIFLINCDQPEISLKSETGIAKAGKFNP